MSNLTSESMRRLFKNKSLSYGDLNLDNLIKLRDIMREELAKPPIGSYRMELTDMFDSKFKEEGSSLEHSFWTVKGFLSDEDGEWLAFESREAISFNRDGFIGFAGWSDSKNVQPFLIAFDEWMEVCFE